MREVGWQTIFWLSAILTTAMLEVLWQGIFWLNDILTSSILHVGSDRKCALCLTYGLEYFRSFILHKKSFTYTKSRAKYHKFCYIKRRQYKWVTSHFELGKWFYGIQNTKYFWRSEILISNDNSMVNLKVSFRKLKCAIFQPEVPIQNADNLMQSSFKLFLWIHRIVGFSHQLVGHLFSSF